MPRIALAICFLAVPALAQPVLLGVTAGGDVYRIDALSGGATLVGSSGVGANAAASDASGRLFTGGGNADQIIEIDPATGAGSVWLTTTGRPAGYGIRGMAFDGAGGLFVILSQADTQAIDTLARIDLASGAYTVIGPTGRTDIQDLAIGPSGALYGVGILGGGELYQINTGTGVATVIGGGSLGNDTQALAFAADGSLFAARANLLRVDPSSAAATVVGATGVADFRGMAFVGATAACYANCDDSTTQPVLNVLDFNCFLNRFAAGEARANCDGSTTIPALNVLDFVCFLNRFAAGCP